MTAIERLPAHPAGKIYGIGGGVGVTYRWRAPASAAAYVEGGNRGIHAN